MSRLAPLDLPGLELLARVAKDVQVVIIGLNDGPVGAGDDDPHAADTAVEEGLEPAVGLL